MQELFTLSQWALYEKYLCDKHNYIYTMYYKKHHCKEGPFSLYLTVSEHWKLCFNHFLRMWSLELWILNLCIAEQWVILFHVQKYFLINTLHIDNVHMQCAAIIKILNSFIFYFFITSNIHNWNMHKWINQFSSYFDAPF